MEGVCQVCGGCLGDDFWPRTSHKGWMASQDSSEDRSEGENVRTFIDDFAARLLWCHVTRSADDCTGLGVRSLLVSCSMLFGRTIATRKFLRKPPIHYLHFAELADHHV